jgi:hypothetical protein
MHFLFLTGISVKIQDSSVGIATGYGLDDRGIAARFPAGTRYLSLFYSVKTCSELFAEGGRFEFLPGYPLRFFVFSSVSPNVGLVPVF